MLNLSRALHMMVEAKRNIISFALIQVNCVCPNKRLLFIFCCGVRSERSVLTRSQTSCTTFQGTEGRQDSPRSYTVYGILGVHAAWTLCDNLSQTNASGLHGFFYLPPVSHTNPFPLLARIRRIHAFPSSRFFIYVPVYASHQLSPM